MTQNFYIQVILPLKLDWQPWYTAPSALRQGDRVTVVFAGKEYPATVWHDAVENAPEGISRISPIAGQENGLPRISKEEIRLWEFIASYYMCTLGEVFRMAYSSQRIAYERSAARKACRKAASESAKEEFAAFEPSLTDAEAPVFIQGEERFQHYVKAIREALSRGGKALVMAPSHADLDALEARLKRHFPDIVPSDARLSNAKRRNANDAARKSGACVISGERNSILLPLKNLALIIVDEEQDPRYKHDDHAPRFNARDCALILAREHGCRVILGSSVLPSMETLLNCLNGRYSRIITTGKPLCPVEVVDINAEFRKHGMVGFFSMKMIKAVESFKGKVVFIRGWEKAEELQEQTKEAFAGRKITTVRITEVSEMNLKGSLTVILQADALVGRDDFRSDEWGLLLVRSLAKRCAALIVQTCTPLRFDPFRNPESILSERRQFGYPPYTRLVEIRKARSGEIKERFFLPKDASLQEKKAGIAGNTPGNCIIDVDPL